jgi:RNA polymerase III RPC4
MRIHESGKMVLIIGGVSLDVAAGLPCYFNSEIVAINAENKTMSMFGQVCVCVCVYMLIFNTSH